MRRLGTAAVLALLAIACDGDHAQIPAPTAPTSSEPAPGPTGQTGCARTSVGLTPLVDLTTGTYQGHRGGLYPGGSNLRPSGHEAAGLSLARAIGPLDGAGAASASGRYVFVSIGMSNTTQEFSVFKRIADPDPGKDPRLMIVDGAQGGVTASDWSSAGCPCWANVDQRLGQAGVTPRQVAVAWLKLANRQPSEGWPQHAQTLKNHTVTVIQILRTRFPNLRLAYLSSRIYAGYATSSLNPEPYAYQSGFSVRWVLDDQLSGSPALNYDPAIGPVSAPWLSWGPYLWADGLTPRSDGLTWACGDFAGDGTHPSDAGRRKVADMLLAFLRSDTTAREWYLAQ